MAEQQGPEQEVPNPGTPGQTEANQEATEQAVTKHEVSEQEAAGQEPFGQEPAAQESVGQDSTPFKETKQAGGESEQKARPVTSFSALGLVPALTAKLEEAGIKEPTPVQAGVIPPLLEGRDGILRSPTGSGKTLAYLLPILQLLDPARRETQAVIFAPTQELAMQIVRVAETYGEPLGIKTVALIGGAALSRQLDRMKGKPALVVGTPGRIREVVSLKKLPLHAIRRVVVDETDRVFSLGGKSDVESVLRGAAKDRQTVFVSATRSDTMRAAEAKWLRDPWETSSEEEQAAGLPPTIEHLHFVADARDKIDLARRVIRTLKPESALLFVNDIERIGELLAKLRYEGFTVDALYGDTPGRERGDVLRKFREGRTKLLIASDVAARGLDVPGLALVLQFEPALDADHYVHRAGRTGRMGRSGRSVTIVTPQERFIMTKLGKQLGIEIQERRLEHGRLVAALPAGAKEARRSSQEASPRFGDNHRKDGFSAPDKTSKDGRNSADFRRTGESAGSRIVRPEAQSRKDAGAPGYKSAGPASSGSFKEANGRSPEGEASRSGQASVRRESPDKRPAPLAGNAKADPSARKPGEKKSASTASSAKPAKITKQQKADRERDRKNKGAPKWLKEKQNASQAPKETE